MKQHQFNRLMVDKTDCNDSWFRCEDDYSVALNRIDSLVEFVNEDLEDLLKNHRFSLRFIERDWCFLLVLVGNDKREYFSEYHTKIADIYKWLDTLNGKVINLNLEV